MERREYTPIDWAAKTLCPGCRNVCPGKFECNKIKLFIDTFIEEKSKGEKQ